MEYLKEAEFALEIAKEATEEILKIYKKQDYEIERKEDDTPLTIADNCSHDVLVKRISEVYPSHGILSEEGRKKGKDDHEYLWILDPLDGTREFIRENDEFSINIALIKNQRPVMGLIYMPVSKECVYAIKGGGTYEVFLDQTPKRLHVSNRLDKLKLIRSRNDVSRAVYRLCEEQRISTILKMGSSFKAALIARGEAEIHYSDGPTCEWDIAPMDIIVQEAGGIFKNLRDEEILYNREDHFNRHGFYMLNRSENKLWEKI